ncbi:MAG: hypothetical protein DDT29_02437 [Dehalococcoidia bacterium]|nr:hypothetical protein [Bacillota bacterium]
MKVYSKLVAMLSSEFHRYLMSKPEFSQDFPTNALVIFKIKEEEEFNRWSEEMALKNREASQRVVRVIVTGWRKMPVWEKVEVERAIEVA